MRTNRALMIAALTAFVLIAGSVSFYAYRASRHGWTQLFDGRTLSGWKASEHEQNWKVQEVFDAKEHRKYVAIKASGPRSHLFYVGTDPKQPPEFKNFHLKADVLTTPGSNSGIYFHTRFERDNWPSIGHEAQVNNSFKPDPQKTGSLYNIVKITTPPANDNKWFTEEIIVRGQHIQIKVDGRTIVDYEEPKDVAGTRKLSSGTFALQAHDPNSVTYFKNIQVKRLDD